MGLVVETGAIVPSANAYVTVADCDTYHTDRGNMAWSEADDSQKTAALIAASAFLDGRYRARFKGYRAQPLVQALEWPRVSVDIDGYQGPLASRGAGRYYLPTNQIPQRIKDATCSLALRALSGPLAPDLDAATSKEKVDVIEVEYAKGYKGSVIYPEIDQLLSDYLKPVNSCDAVRG